MDTVSLAEAKAHLSALVDRVVAGEAITITRRGRAVARLSALPDAMQPVDLEALQALTAGMPTPSQGSAAFVRAMRDDDRY